MWGGLKRDAVALFGEQELEPQSIQSLYLLPNLLARRLCVLQARFDMADDHRDPPQGISGLLLMHQCRQAAQLLHEPLRRQMAV